MTRERRAPSTTDEESTPTVAHATPAKADPPAKAGTATSPRRRKAATPSDDVASSPPEQPDASASPGFAKRRDPARTRSEAEAQYVAARDVWTAAMKSAASGRPADLAALAIAQETYETAAIDWERWESGERVAIAIETEKTSHVGAIVEQELAWRKVQQPEKPAGILSRLGRRVRGR